MKRSKTWAQRLLDGRVAHVEILTKPYGGARQGDKMLVATPLLVDQYIRKIPCGESRSVAQLRTDLARAHGADIACPISTSIFVRIAAEAALESLRDGTSVSTVTPFWRVVDETSPIANRLSCGAEFVRHQRILETAATVPIPA